MGLGLFGQRAELRLSSTRNLPGAPTTSPDLTMSVDKDPKHMQNQYGTVCLITEPGRADRLMEVSRKRKLAEKVLLKGPVDSWDI